MAADAEIGHQFRLGGQRVAGPEFAIEDDPHDLPLDPAADTPFVTAPVSGLRRHVSHRTLARARRPPSRSDDGVSDLRFTAPLVAPLTTTPFVCVPLTAPTPAPMVTLPPVT
ncbi:hypothetical protein GCM10022207_16450 [Streptomyces lannensis]|uniref:Uncharacterized protein n=1 Tax=Streptomyces lannensis TaxID=766498 RepID=A0ABP7JTM5_9ACTN